MQNLQKISVASLLLLARNTQCKGKYLTYLHCVRKIHQKALLVMHRKCCWIFQVKGSAPMGLSKNFCDKSMYFETGRHLPGFCISSVNFMTHQRTEIRDVWDMSFKLIREHLPALLTHALKAPSAGFHSPSVGNVSIIRSICSEATRCTFKRTFCIHLSKHSRLYMITTCVNSVAEIYYTNRLQIAVNY